MISGFLEWLGQTPWSVKLLESIWAWPLLESAHVLGITLFVGTTMMMDLRLMGVTFGGIRASDFTSRMLPWTRAGFAAMLTTGLLVFYSNPVHYYHNIFFRFKIILLVLAGLNVWLFHSKIHRQVADWDLQDKPPRAARIAGGVSIVAWMLVVMCGRFIAYNWFDCDIQPQPAFVNWASGCVIPPPAE
jgi:Family of unknown function (DUF6644)